MKNKLHQTSTTLLMEYISVSKYPNQYTYISLSTKQNRSGQSLDPLPYNEPIARRVRICIIYLLRFFKKYKMFCLFQLKCINKQRFYRIVHTGSPGFINQQCLVHYPYISGQLLLVEQWLALLPYSKKVMSSFKKPDGDGGSQVQYFCIVQRLYYTILYYRYFHITEYRKELSALFSQPLAC